MRQSRKTMLVSDGERKKRPEVMTPKREVLNNTFLRNTVKCFLGREECASIVSSLMASCLNQVPERFRFDLDDEDVATDRRCKHRIRDLCDDLKIRIGDRIASKLGSRSDVRVSVIDHDSSPMKRILQIQIHVFDEENDTRTMTYRRDVELIFVNDNVA